MLPQTNTGNVFQFANKIKDFPYFNGFQFPVWGLPWTVIWLIFGCLYNPCESRQKWKIAWHYFSISWCHYDSCFQSNLSQGEVKRTSLGVQQSIAIFAVLKRPDQQGAGYYRIWALLTFLLGEVSYPKQHLGGPIFCTAVRDSLRISVAARYEQSTFPQRTELFSEYFNYPWYMKY